MKEEPNISYYVVSVDSQVLYFTNDYHIAKKRQSKLKHGGVKCYIKSSSTKIDNRPICQMMLIWCDGQYDLILRKDFGVVLYFLKFCPL